MHAKTLHKKKKLNNLIFWYEGMIMNFEDHVPFHVILYVRII